MSNVQQQQQITPAAPDRKLVAGKPDYERCDNQVISARYSLLSFLPKAILEQFRRFANLYFLFVGVIMFLGTYTEWFESAFSPWTTLGPLAIVISISLLVEGASDYKRHLNDAEMNNASCVILRRTGDPDEEDEEKNMKRDETILQGRDVSVNINKAYYANSGTSIRGARQRTMTDPNDPQAEMVNVAFQKRKRKDIRQGHFVLVKNREMVPADLLLLASSNDQGGAYIETSSIDGETNLKLRNSPHLPPRILKALRAGSVVKTAMAKIDEGHESLDTNVVPEFETIDAAVKRLTRMSALGRPNATSALEHPTAQADNNNRSDEEAAAAKKRSSSGLKDMMKDFSVNMSPLVTRKSKKYYAEDAGKYVAALTTEAPNASVHTFSGRLTLPPVSEGCVHEIPLGPDNVLLRGAMLRNTEWAIGLAFFTGTDTKLVQNSFETPSKFSQLDTLMNRTVVVILILMVAIMAYLSTAAVIYNNQKFDNLFYAGYNKNTTELWPYFPESSGIIEPPDWNPSPDMWIQYFFLFITLLSNFVPLSLYITIEMVQVVLLWFIYADIEMYDDTTDTRAVARSTIVSDLGRIAYIFSDKTGTLTQNVMRFKRCSVDGMAFGAPIERKRPGINVEEILDEPPSQFHPLRQLLVGRIENGTIGLENLGDSTPAGGNGSDGKLTFHAEMFLRIMSLCHTVVVEKDIEKKEHISGGMSVSSHASSRSASSIVKNLFRGGNRKRTDTGGSGLGPLSVVSENIEVSNSPDVFRERMNTTNHSLSDIKKEKNTDGAPMGYAYQAESPDEGALVSAASTTFGFQVTGRDINGIRLRCVFPSHLQDRKVIDGLKSRTLSLDRLAAETAIDLPNRAQSSSSSGLSNSLHDLTSKNEPRDETWTILAVNKFDSDRKRMSILLRSPPELGSLPILFCKGADSAMLDSGISDGNGITSAADSVRNSFDMEPVTECDEEDDGDGDEVAYTLANLLGIQVHLGEFAKEGLRTLVLGMRVLTEEECSEWMKIYKAASISLKNRKELLTEAAIQIEKNIHIVGATAIEDKLQKNVPETIANLEKAGIKLWVLTGDKRETAVEIGYSTHVLTSKMHLTEVPDNGKEHVRAQVATEFMRLIKHGRLTEYQMASLQKTKARSWKDKVRRISTNFQFLLGKFKRAFSRTVMAFSATLLGLIGMKERSSKKLQRVAEKKEAEKFIIKDLERRKRVREAAEKVIISWRESEKAKKSRRERPPQVEESEEDDLATEDLPAVFNRASSARSVLNDIRISGSITSIEVRELSLAYLTAQQAQSGDERSHSVVEEDALSLDSWLPDLAAGIHGDFDKKKRTLLERLFAVDRDVRKGRLKKHVRKEILDPKKKGIDFHSKDRVSIAGSRALVIEGSALKHLLGDPDMEEILFAVASNCDAVIACRVSPKQKAQLVNLVRHNVKPEPTTLAIGDGANDVGMIQEAHVGVGISGKEGKQAVNASDFAIAQFRFLETLILIHGRWNFFRLSQAVLFSFYKNAVLAGIIIVFTTRTVYSGTSIFDQWVVSMFNFVAAAPIFFLGFFDRCLSKNYVRANPQVYRPTRENELITLRVLIRWIFICVVHVVTLFFFTVPQQSYGGGITSAFEGLMSTNLDRDLPGDGEGGDLKSVGTVTFTCMVIMLAYKVLYEGRSLVHGKWPSITCRKGSEGFINRLAYTWIGMSYLSIVFYFFGISIYQLLGRSGAGQFSNFTDVTNHILGARSLTWMLISFVPIMAMVSDVVLKVFSNMFYPTQTQIHLEIEAKQKRERKRRERRERKASFLQSRDRLNSSDLREVTA